MLRSTTSSTFTRVSASAQGFCPTGTTAARATCAASALIMCCRPGERSEADRNVDWMQAQIEETLKLKSAALNGEASV